jgi:predicted Rossmann fold flavoprotein
MKRAVIVGAGAGGYFTAILLKERSPEWDVIILEKSTKVLQKVKVSGGGRCNVTNGRSAPGELVDFYPRGGRKLYKLLKNFSTSDMRNWLESHGVHTHEEADKRVFPVSNSSQTIIDLFESRAKKSGVRLELGCGANQLMKTPTGWQITHSKGSIKCDVVIVASGASPAMWQVLADMGIQINAPVPSLFTFHIKDKRIGDLQGISFPQAKLKVATTDLLEQGPLLITHWGLSGPAVLKLSAWGARPLADLKYKFSLLVNFIDLTYDECQRDLNALKSNHPTRKLANHIPFDLPRRFWERLISIAGISQKTFGELSKSDINKITEELTQALYKVDGKSAFKEEFVTCGGVDIGEVDLETMQAKNFPGLYFVGEVLDIDALTGGFNFQACWSGGWAVVQSL